MADRFYTTESLDLGEFVLDLGKPGTERPGRPHITQIDGIGGRQHAGPRVAESARDRPSIDVQPEKHRGVGPA